MLRRLGWTIVLALTLTACDRADGDESVAVPTRERASQIDGDYLATGGDGSNWAMTGYGYDEQRYSPLDYINETNVDRLGIAWFADLPDMRGQEATPLAVDGKIYITTAWSKVFAYDAKSGRELWSYDPEVPHEIAINACCDVVNRGPAFWKGKLFFGTLDGRLIALDAVTGAQLWSVQTTPADKPYTITGVPRVFKNMVVIGNGGAEFGVRGFVTAYDVNTGRKKWRFYTVPNPEGEPDGEASDDVLKTAYRTWSKDGEWTESGGGGTVWDAIVYDHELDQLYIGVGNGNPWNHGLRSNGEGDNLFLSSIVALDPDTGEYIWHFQETPGESWDYTAAQPIILADLDLPVEKKADGARSGGGDAKSATESRKVLLHAPKNGFFFVLDRVTGKLLSAEPFVDNINWATGYDLETGRPKENPQARFYKTGKPFVAIPGALGAHNWHPMSYNPGTGLVYIPANQIPQAYAQPGDELDAKRQPIGFNVGSSWAAGQLPDDKAAFRAAIASTKGRLVAFDPVKGEAAWTQDYPAAWNGGTMTSAGNLVFQGTSLGYFKIYNAGDGAELRSIDVQSGVVGAPSTFLVGGEQYVAFLTSKGGAFPLVAGVAGGEARTVPNIPRLIVMKLGGTARLPALPEAEPIAWDPPEAQGSPDQIARGKALYGRFCLVCHGDSAIGNGFTPDLRVSGTLSSENAWRSIVVDGALEDSGMVSFEEVLSPHEAELIRYYVIARSRWTKEHLPDIARPVRARR